MESKWDKRFMRVAREISSWSKDPSKQIGAVAVNSDRRILATGYNGFPQGIKMHLIGMKIVVLNMIL